MITIRPFAAAPLTPAQTTAIDDIFFSSSATQTFAGPEVRAAFRERWLGRYLRFDGGDAFLALDARDDVVGYVVGTIADLAKLPRFADLASARTFAKLSAVFPAHLHINVAADARNQGIGARLIEAFAVHALAKGTPGMHVVTSPASRNISFYGRCGFEELGRAGAGAAAIVFLARRLADHPAPSAPASLPCPS